MHFINAHSLRKSKIIKFITSNDCFFSEKRRDDQTEQWESMNNIYSHDYYKYRRNMEVTFQSLNENNKSLMYQVNSDHQEFVNTIIHDYEKLIKEECDCSYRKIPGLKSS